MTEKQIKRAWDTIYRKREAAAKKLDIETCEICGDLNGLRFWHERGYINCSEVSRLFKEYADKAIIAKEEYSEKPIDSRFYRLEFGIPIYLYAASVFYDPVVF